MFTRTKLCNPEIYSKLSPNIVDINASWEMPIENDNKLFYRRCFNSNGEILTNIMASLYQVPAKNCLVFSSCIGIACTISATKQFKRILVIKTTYPEMIYAYGSHRTPIEIDEDFDDFREGDLLCFDTVELENCKVTDYKSLVDRAHKAHAKVCIDNTVATWYNNTCKYYDPDITMESLSKFANGLNNAILGWVYCKDPDDYQMLKIKYGTLGFAPHPVDCYLTICNLQTMDFRLNQIAKTSNRIVNKLNELNIIKERDYYCYEPTGIFMFKVNDKNALDKLWKTELNYIRRAVTFGAGFTTIDMGEIFKDENLIRVSIGLEDFDDLWPDLKNVLKTLNYALP